MIRHAYSACHACHFDPSGGGALTAYGRSVAGTALHTRFGDAAAEDPSSGFLFGLAPTPEWLELGGDVRVMALRTKSKGVPTIERTVWMQLDGEATVSFENFVASGSLGYAPEGALGSALTRGTDGNLISRQHWLAYRNDSSNLWLRLGRMNLPFGIRTIEHTLGVRQLTATNINDQQQYGAAVFVAADPVRAELMAIGGNLQLRPDDYRERGYSTYLELMVMDRLGLGVSSLLTHRERDTITLKETWRHAHGGFARWSPTELLVLQTEWDYVLNSSRDEFHRKGWVGYLQADIEFEQGMHVLLTGETNKVGSRIRYRSWTGWLSYAWFFAPHADLRFDIIRQSLGSSVGRSSSTTLLLQGHIFL